MIKKELVLAIVFTIIAVFFVWDGFHESVSELAQGSAMGFFIFFLLALGSWGIFIEDVVDWIKDRRVK